MAFSRMDLAYPKGIEPLISGVLARPVMKRMSAATIEPEDEDRQRGEDEHPGVALPGSHPLI